MLGAGPYPDGGVPADDARALGSAYPCRTGGGPYGGLPSGREVLVRSSLTLGSFGNGSVGLSAKLLLGKPALISERRESGGLGGPVPIGNRLEAYRWGGFDPFIEQAALV